MRTADHHIFPLNFDSLRPLHIVRAIASVLAVVLLGNSVALAAGAPHVQTAMDPAKLEQKLTARGIGKSVKVTELDGTTVSGNLTAIRDDAFDVTLKKATQPITISYSQVSEEGNGGLTTGAKIGVVVSCVVVAAAVVAVVVASKI
jgi:sulfur transfer complex TusBCD TusB component (DsrH family)